MAGGPRNLLLALVLGLAAGGTTAWVVHDQRTEAHEQRLGAPSPRLQAALDELRDDGVHVAADARHLVDAPAERAIEAAAARTDRPIHTIVWTGSRHAGDGALLGEKLERAFADQEALVLVWEGPGQGLVEQVGVRVSGAPSPSDFVGDPATVLPRLVTEAGQSPWHEPPAADVDTRAGLLEGAALGALAAVPASLLLLLAARLLRRATGRGRELPGRWGWSRRGLRRP